MGIQLFARNAFLDVNRKRFFLNPNLYGGVATFSRNVFHVMASNFVFVGRRGFNFKCGEIRYQWRESDVI